MGGHGLQQGQCQIFSPGRPLARLQKWTVGVGHTSEEEGGQRQRERERQPETESEIRQVRQTGGGDGEEAGNGAEILTSRFIRILRIPVREQYKAKETDIRPEADGSGRSTGAARMGDASRWGRAEKGALGWAGVGGKWHVPAKARGDASWDLEETKESPPAPPSSKLLESERPGLAHAPTRGEDGKWGRRQGILGNMG